MRGSDYLLQKTKRVIPEKTHTPPTEEISAVRRGRGLFLIIGNVLGNPKGVVGLTSNFLCGGGMDVFWNDPMKVFYTSGNRFREQIV